MRYDLIDLRGDFKINNTIGSDGYAIGYNGSSIDWIQNSGGGTASLLQNKGRNYRIFGSTGSDVENANRFCNFFTNIGSEWFGSPTNENRFTLFLMPGVYDFTTSQFTPINYIDIIGLSDNPYNVVLKNSSSGEIFNDKFGTNWGLQNVYIGEEGYCFQQADSSDLYWNWNNVVVGKELCTAPQIWSAMRGKFENITVLDGATFGISQGDISVDFRNSTFGTVNDCFVSSQDINGTFKNLYFNEIKGNAFSTTNNLIGTYSDISVDKISNNSISLYVFKGDVSIEGTFKDIIIGSGSRAIIFDGQSQNGLYEDIKIGTCKEFFMSGRKAGNYRNLKVNEAENIFKVDELCINLDGFDFKASGYVFGGGLVDSEIKNGKVRTIDNKTLPVVFQAAEGQRIYATLSNLEIAADTAFITSNTSTNVNVSHSKILANSICTPVDSGFTFKAQNCTFGTISSSLTNAFYNNSVYNLYVNFRNIDFKGEFLHLIGCNGGPIIEANLYNIKIDGANYLINGSDSLLGDVYNLTANFVGGFSIANDTIQCDFEKINIPRIDGDAFRTSTINGNTFRDIKMGDPQNFFRVGTIDSLPADSVGYTFSNVFDKIDLGNVGTSCFWSENGTTGKIRGLFNDIKIKSIGIDNIPSVGAFVAWHNSLVTKSSITGFFKNISIGVSNGPVFSAKYPYSGDVYQRIGPGNFENITVGSCSEFFVGDTTLDTKIRNVKMRGGWKTRKHLGSIENSIFDQTGVNATQSISNAGMIKRTFIYSNTAMNLQDHANPGQYGFYLQSSFNSVSNAPTTFTNSFFNSIDSNYKSP